ncbi:Nephrocystin-3 [Penicillium rolfsii]|nr:Nephrocystin-3 [Penicillium rolfsii]
MDARTRSPDDYTVGWICALPVEAAAAKLMLDKIHPPLPRLPMDQNAYIFGNIGEHNVVITTLPTGAYGTTSAATVGMQLLSSFHAIRFGLMVGIGGGVPSSCADIRLGDIVVSQPTETSGGVIQYDLGKALSGGQFKRTGMLNRPPKVLLTALATLQAHHLTEDSQAVGFISNLQAKLSPHKVTKFTRPTQEDCLFQAEYDHIISDTCIDYDRSRLVSRPQREHQEPVIHYGLIGSANQVIKDGRRRDQLARDLDIYYMEMEAAGLMNDFPCLVIRGICDYADSHKNKEWQGYAAAAAAAYAKELLLVVTVDQINCTPTTRDTLANSVHRFNILLDLTAVPVIENFVGRQGEDSQSRKVAIIHGLGGIGKTQLAIRFARDHKHDFTAIFWLRGKDRGTLLQSLSSILPRLPEQSYTDEAMNDEEVKQRARQVLKWLAVEGNSRWLIIFDNIDQYFPFKGPIGDAYDIADFFPGADHGSIIITTRLQGLTELGQSFPLYKLDPEDAIPLLLQSSRISRKNIAKEIESHPDTVALANRLDGLPLAIAIAGAFMRETGTSIHEYLQYYQSSWSDLQVQSNPERQYQQGNMLQTWMISYREIQKRDPNAAALLLFLARFDNRDIWYELIQSSHHSSNAPIWLKRTISSGLAFKAGMKTLVGLSFLETKEQSGSYMMHPVIQDWCIHLASREKNVDPLHLDALALICVGYTVPRVGDRKHLEVQQRLLPHAKYVSHKDWSEENIGVWEALHRLGNLFHAQGKLDDSVEMYQKSLAGKERVLGQNHPSTLDTVSDLGNLYRERGKLEEVEDIYRRAIAGYKEALGPDHPSTFKAVGNLGNLYRDQGKLEEAKEMYQEALAGKERVLGRENTSTLNTVSNLGNLYRDQGKLGQAGQMYQQALAGYEKILGPDHPFSLNAVGNLGTLHRDQGNLKEAEEMYQRALIGYENYLSQDHPSVLTIVGNLGGLYRDQGKLQEAEEIYQQALVGKERILGPSHTSTLKTISNLASLYRDKGKLKDAKEMYQRALVGYENALHPDHPVTLSIIGNLDSVYREERELDKSKEACSED